MKRRIPVAAAVLTVALAQQPQAWAEVGLPASARPVPAREESLRSFNTATGLLDRGLYDLAADEYRSFLANGTNQPQNDVARYGLAVCLFRLEQHADAVEQLEHLNDLADFLYAAEVGVMLGRSYLTLERHEPAIAVFEQVIRTHRDHGLADEAVAGAAEALYRAGRFDDAIVRARTLMSRWPKSSRRPQVLFYWALSEMGRENYDVAVEQFRELLAARPEEALAAPSRLFLAQSLEQTDHLEEAATVYGQIVGRADSEYHTHAVTALAGILRRQGRLQEAGELLDRLPNDGAEGSLATETAIQRARIRFEQGEFDAALKALQGAEQTADARGDEIAYWTAKCELHKGDFAGAAHGFGQLIERHPESELLPEARYDRAVALIRAGETESADESLADFRRQHPQHELAPQALRLRAVLSHQAGEYNVSRQHCRAYLRGHPGGPDTAEMSFLAAENDYLAGRLQQAIKEYEAFLATHSGDSRAATARFRLGMAAYQQGRPSEATSYLEDLCGQSIVPEAFQLALLALGDIYFQRSEWKNAEHLLDRYVADVPDSAQIDEALLKLGLSRQRQGNHREAVTTYDRLLVNTERSKQRRRAAFERGQALLQLGELEAATEAFEAVLAQGAHDATGGYALYQLGSQAMQAGEYKSAAERFARAEGSPTDPDTKAEACFQRGQALMAAELYDQAHQVFESFLKRFATHNRALQARVQAATALARQGRNSDAVTAIAELNKRGGQALSAAARANLQYEKAWSLRSMGDSAAAARAYEHLLANPSASAELAAHATLELAGLHFEAKNYEMAAELLSKLCDSTPDGAPPLSAGAREQAVYYLAANHFELERFGEAARMFEEFLGEFHGSELRAAAALYCGEALLRTGRHERAVKYLSEVVDGFPDDPACGPAMLRLGEALAVLQRWARSERVLTEHLERYPEGEHSYQAQFGLGWARENQQRYDEAIAAYRQVVDRHRGATAARAQFQIGECRYAQEKYDDAVRELLKVDILYAYPEWSAAALYEAGRCFEELRKHAEARQQFERVAQKYPGSKWSPLASRRLATVAADALPGR